MTIEEALREADNLTTVLAHEGKDYDLSHDISRMTEVADNLGYDIWAVANVTESKSGEYFHRFWSCNIRKHNEVPWWTTLPYETQLKAFRAAFIEIVERKLNEERRA